MNTLRRQLIVWILASTALLISCLSGTYIFLKDSLPSDSKYIITHLHEYNFNVEAARKKGYSDEEMTAFFNKQLESEFERQWMRIVVVALALYFVSVLGFVANFVRRSAVVAKENIKTIDSTNDQILFVMEDKFVTGVVSLFCGGIGWFVTNYWMKPILQFRELKSKILFDFVFYAQVVNADGLGERLRKLYDDRIDANRRTSAALSVSILELPRWYKYFLKTRGCNLEVAAANLIGFSNTTDYEAASSRVNKIKSALGIMTDTIQRDKFCAKCKFVLIGR